MVRKILAVLFGYAAIVLVVIVSDVVYFLVFRQKTTYLAYHLAASALAGVLGGYLAALIGRTSPFGHALALGIFSQVLGIVTLLSEFGTAPTWFLIALLAMVLPLALMGGYLRSLQVDASHKASR